MQLAHQQSPWREMKPYGMLDFERWYINGIEHRGRAYASEVVLCEVDSGSNAHKTFRRYDHGNFKN